MLRCASLENPGPERTPARRRFGTIAFTVAIGWFTSSLTVQARAADLSIGNQGIRVNQPATLETEFVESHGAYQSTFGVINLTTREKTPLLTETKPSDNPATIFNPSTKIDDAGSPRDFPGTPGNTVTQPASRYSFRPNNDYVFYLESTFNGRPTGILYSTDRLNPNSEQHVRFTGAINSLCQTGGMTIGWDDTGSRIVRNRQQQDRDYDDFIVRLRDTACPVGGGEPPPVASPAAPAGPVGQLPVAAPAAGGGFSFLPIGLGLLGAGGLAAVLATGGGDDDNDNGSSTTPGGTLPGGGGTGGGGGGGGGGGAGGGGTTPEPIPEPLTILGSGAAIGFATLMQRRRSKNRKKN